MSDEARMPSFRTEFWQDPPVVVLIFFHNGEEHRFEVPVQTYTVVRRGYDHDDTEVLVADGKVVDK